MYNSGWITPYSAEVEAGETFQFSSQQQDRDCYQNLYSPYPVEANWTINDDQIATVGFDGSTTAISEGDAYLTANWTGQFWWADATEACLPDEIPVNRTANLIVPSAILFKTLSNDVNSEIATFSQGIGSQTANVNLSGGRQVCTGSRTSFNITINFDLPPDAVSIFHPDSRTFVSDSETQQFQYLSFDFQDVSYSLRRGKMIINLRRVRPTAADNSIRIRITGGLQAGGSYNGNAKVTFTCP